MERLSKAIADAKASWEKRGPTAHSESEQYLRRRDVRETLSASGLPAWTWCRFGSERFSKLGPSAARFSPAPRVWARPCAP